MRFAQQLYEGIELGAEGFDRSDHLHAHGLSPDLGRGGNQGQGVDQARSTARSTSAGARTRQGEPRRAGRPRGDPADRRQPDTRIDPRAPERGPAQALRPDLAALRREPDGARRLRPDAGSRSRAASSSFAPTAPSSRSTASTRCGRARRDGEARPARSSRRARRSTTTAIKPEQHFSQPPPRYSEATLINELEQRGIGRPSTYAPDRRDDQGPRLRRACKERRLHPTRIGEAVNTLMVEHFKVISDDDYTATLEKRLDEVEHGSEEWVPVVGGFYGPAAEDAGGGRGGDAGRHGRGVPAVQRGSPGAQGEPLRAVHGLLALPEVQVPPGAARPTASCRSRSCWRRRARTAASRCSCATAGTASSWAAPVIPSASTSSATRPRARRSRRARSARSAEKGSSSSARAATGRSSHARATQSASTEPTWARTASRREGPKLLDEPCPICGKPMVERRGRYGLFKSCSDYPKCPGPKGVKNWRPPHRIRHRSPIAAIELQP